MRKEIKFSHANIEEGYTFNYVAKQAAGSVWLKEGNTVLLATVAMEPTQESDEDFVPLTVQYIEKSYAAGRIPGGFIKRESKPSDFETLTSRLIDRSLRPLFPKGFNQAVQVTVMVLSVDEHADLQRMALNAASAALFTSSIPVKTTVAAARLTRIDEAWVVNPSQEELLSGSLDLFLAGTKEELLMIEMRALAGFREEMIELPLLDPMLDPTLANQSIQIQSDNALHEELLVEAIDTLQDVIFETARSYHDAFLEVADEKIALKNSQEKALEPLYAHIKAHYQERIDASLDALAKSERALVLQELTEEIAASEFCTQEDFTFKEVEKAVQSIKREAVRHQILNKHIRADGRLLDEVRPISIETNILPQAHASTLFTRGETQVLAALTLGGSQDAQMYQNLTDSSSQYESLMIHYNFPGFSVGEASRIGPAGRRELGHGNLAKRAIEPTFDNSNGKTARIVSEVLESNGSSSMATVCASSLALKAANLSITNLVAGVAMGLVMDEKRYAILTDIMGLEDHDGDMDFKVAGTKEGITALQMDIKLGGISLDILKEALEQAKKARMHILALMEDAVEHIVENEGVLPSMEHFVVDPSRIADIIGQAGKTIRSIIEKFDVAIDLDRDKGNVKISGSDKSKIAQAKEEIRNITSSVKKEYQVGDVVEGRVKKIVDFGAFIELDPGNDGLLHISKISQERIAHASEVLSEGEPIRVRISGFKGKKIELERA